MELDVKKENVIEEKSYAFALKTVRLYRHLTERESAREFILSKQLLRSGTAIGSLVQESQEAESAKDFIHKLAIARKEARETSYWLRLLVDSGYMDESTATSHMSDVAELKRILAAIILSTKRKIAA